MSDDRSRRLVDETPFDSPRAVLANLDAQALAAVQQFIEESGGIDNALLAIELLDVLGELEHREEAA